MEALQKKILAARPKDSIGRYDLLPLLSDRELSGQVADALAAPYMGKADIVVAPEALGWLLGEKIAHRLDVGMLPLGVASLLLGMLVSAAMTTILTGTL